MTTQDLIMRLSKFPPSTPVFIYDDSTTLEPVDVYESYGGAVIFGEVYAGE